MGRDQVVGTEPRIQQISVQGAAMVLAADDGAWTAIDPVPSAAQCLLNDVSVVSATEVWVVGQTGSAPVIQRWDGSEWTVEAHQLPAGVSRADLRGVSALAGTGVAVGAKLDRSVRREIPLILHWEGLDWTVADPPDLGAPYVLTDVIQVSRREAWAVGHGLPPGGLGGVVLHWDGSAWTKAATPVTGSLMALAMTSPDDVWAAGEDGGRRPCLLHFDGTQWRETPTAGARRGLTGVAARSATDAWAVGPDSLFHWEGSEWSPTQADGLSGASTVVATGTETWIAGGGGRLARFDGARWQRHSVRADAVWTGSASGAAGDVWLVGSQRLVHQSPPIP
jgi:hypothetical protein